MNNSGLIFGLDSIRIDADIKSKEEGLKFLAKAALEIGLTDDVEGTLQGLLEREKEFSTGLGDRIAIPHTKWRSIKNSGIVIVKPMVPVEWDSLDGQPVSIMIGILTPDDNSGNVHLKLLASLSRSLIEEDFTRKLIESRDREEILKMVNQALTAFNNK